MFLGPSSEDKIVKQNRQGVSLPSEISAQRKGQKWVHPSTAEQESALSLESALVMTHTGPETGMENRESPMGVKINGKKSGPSSLWVLERKGWATEDLKRSR